MLWTLEGAGLLAAAALTLNLVLGAIVYSAAVLIGCSRRSRVGAPLTDRPHPG